MATDPSQPLPAMFAERTPQPPQRSALPWIVAAATALILIGFLLVLGHRRPAHPANSQQALDPYASRLIFSDLVMSESTSLSGGKSTYIDGHIRNAGDRTVTSATVQVLFANDEALPPQVETTPVGLIRTREPYVDTQPVSAAPLAPGDERDFRLIFESIGPNWNQQVPQVRLVSATLR